MVASAVQALVKRKDQTRFTLKSDFKSMFPLHLDIFMYVDNCMQHSLIYYMCMFIIECNIREFFMKKLMVMM